MSKPARGRWFIALLAVGLGVAAAWWWQGSLPAPVTSIQDGKTIDFSTGQAVVRDDAADRAALEKAKREMDAATADITFAPTKPEETTGAKHQ
ncbi:MAG: hypothetical protein IT582_11715 [Opitutaceae bacterium]|nr:hypothetical protein [Opitutaceae bacterium]